MCAQLVDDRRFQAYEVEQASEVLGRLLTGVFGVNRDGYRRVDFPAVEVSAHQEVDESLGTRCSLGIEAQSLRVEVVGDVLCHLCVECADICVLLDVLLLEIHNFAFANWNLHRFVGQFIGA